MGETMVERVAKAIYNITAPDNAGTFEHDRYYRRDYLIAARAAIEAMRNPTADMYIAATNVDFWVGGDDGDREEYVTNSIFERVWFASIDAALGEHSDE